MKGQILNRAMAAVSLGITGYYIYNITTHMINPGWDTDFTRMLMFFCIATIPLVFLLGFVGAREHVWPKLKTHARNAANGSVFWYRTILVGFSLVGVIMPLGFLILIWFFMVELRFGLFFLLYFIPTITRLIRAPARDALIFAGFQIGNFFISPLIAFGIIWIFGKYVSDLLPWGRHILEIFGENYDEQTSINTFFWICVFALVNQLIEFFYAVKILIGRKRNESVSK